MSENKYRRSLLEFRRALLFIFGSVFTLLVAAAAGDTTRGEALFGVPIGLFILWLVTTIEGIPLGIVMLVAPGWRQLPLTERRGIAVGYLLVGLVNFLSLSFHVTHAVPGFPAYAPAVIYGLAFSAVYAKVYATDEISEELFP